MARRTPSPAMYREAEKMAGSRVGPGVGRPLGWSLGVSNRTGRTFWVIPSRDNARREKRGLPLVAYYTSLDGSGCTCEGFNGNEANGFTGAGICTHALAATIVFDAAAEADGSDGLASPAEVDAAFAGVAADHEAVAEAERHLASARAGHMVTRPGHLTPAFAPPRTGALQHVEARRAYDDLFPDDGEG